MGATEESVRVQTEDGDNATLRHHRQLALGPVRSNALRDADAYDLGEILWNYLRVPAEPGPFEESPSDTLILVLGSPDLSVAGHAAHLLEQKIAEHAVISGGRKVPGQPRCLEADAIAKLMHKRHIDPHRLILERHSYHTSDHFWKTERLLADHPDVAGAVNPPRYVVLVPSPIAEFRALATGRRRWPDSNFRVEGVPISYLEYMSRNNVATVLGRMVGEIERITTYPKRGFMIKSDDPPEHVMEAYRQLHQDFNNRPAPRAWFSPIIFLMSNSARFLPR